MKFHKSAIIAFGGALFNATLDGKTGLPFFTELHIPGGSVIDVGKAQGNGNKCYLAFKGGFPGVSEWLQSKSCSPGLKLGGHQGRTFLPGDCLEIAALDDFKEFSEGYKIPSSLLPNYDTSVQTIRVTGGPHDTPDIASEAGLKELYSTAYSVNFNSNRGAIRLDGPAFKFGRKNGGEGGGHASNVMEYPYPSGGLSAVGSTMVLFGVDGGTLSGFTCISVPTEVDFWKFGQAAIGSEIRFKLIDYQDSMKLRRQRNEYLEIISKRPVSSTVAFDDELPSYKSIPLLGEFLYHSGTRDEGLPPVAFRQAGDGMILIDYGLEEYSLFNNGRQYVLDNLIMEKIGTDILATESDTGSYAVCFDPIKTDRDQLLAKIIELEASIPPIESLKVPSRIFRLPICFDHQALKHCIDRYTHSQRPHAAYLPSNVDYLMRANDIKTFDEFKKGIVGHSQIVTAVSFFCANPLMVFIDPRSRFSTSKYNPSRTETPAGAIGSGSMCQSVYSVDSPGGYMLWGFTLPNWYWDTFSRVHEEPWLLQNFDQVIYYEVDEEELDRLNVMWQTKRLEFKPEQAEFDFVEYKKFLDTIESEVTLLKARRSESFHKLILEEEADLAKWEAEKLASKAERSSANKLLQGSNVIKVKSTMPANIFKINFKEGDEFSGEDPVVTLESMKMEIPLRVSGADSYTPTKYRVLAILVDEGDVVSPGEPLIAVEKL